MAKVAFCVGAQHVPTMRPGCYVAGFSAPLAMGYNEHPPLGWGTRKPPTDKGKP